MSIENQATFYSRNVSDYNPNITGACLSESAVSGFDEFSHLLRVIYADWRSYETSKAESVRTKIGIMSDDLENYHNLTNTLDCLYTVASVGELCTEGENKYFKVDKILFKATHKKPVSFSFAMLEKYSFRFSYFKNTNEVGEYKKCDSFHVYYENGLSLLESVKLLTQISKRRQILMYALPNARVFHCACRCGRKRSRPSRFLNPPLQ